MRTTKKNVQSTHTAHKKKKKKAPLGLGRKIMLVICLIVFVGSAGVLLDYFINGAREQSALTDLSSMKLDGEEIVTDKGVVSAEYSNLYKANPDIIGWVTVDDTKIDYPVMQTQGDPEYYLRRGFDGQSTSSGTPFMDAASDIFIPTSNFLIYGHNMKNGTMFHDLLKYDSKDFWEEHKTFRFDTIYKGGKGEYEVVAACFSKIYAKDSKKFKYYQYPGITTESEFYEYVRGVKSESVYDTEVSVEYGDQLVTLSTCAYHTDDGRFYVVGRKVN